MKILDLIATHQREITAAATVVIAIMACLTWRVTRTLSQENRLLRKAGTEPKVVAYLTPKLGSYVPHVDLVVANIGQGPAQNVVYRIEAKEENFKQYNVQFLKNNSQPMIAFLPQGERISVVFGTRDLFGQRGSEFESYKSPFPPFNVTVSYQNLEGKSYTNTHLLDVSNFANMGGTLVSPEYVIAEALKKVERHMYKLTKNL